MPRFIQRTFAGGEWSPKLSSRSDLEGYASACERLENAIIDLGGATSKRPGFIYIESTKDSTAQSILVSHVIDKDTSFILEFGELYIRFFKDQAQVLSGGNPYEIATTYLEAALSGLDIFQNGENLIILHEDYRPRELVRTTDTNWALNTMNFRPGALNENGFEPSATLTLGAVTGLGITFTAGSAVFLESDVGRGIESGTGKAVITDFTSTSIVTCDIINDFAAVGPIASGSWTVTGSPNTAIKVYGTNPVGSIVTVGASKGIEVFTDALSAGNNWWTLSPAIGNGVYYLQTGVSAYTTQKPHAVYVDGKKITDLTAALLSVDPQTYMAATKEYAWFFGNADSLGADTIYLRLDDPVDPDTKSTALDPKNSYIQYSHISESKQLWRSGDVGKFIKANGGVLKITQYLTPYLVEAQIILSPGTTDSGAGWTLQEEVWNSTNGFPSSGCFFEERLVLARGKTIWGSVVGNDNYLNFSTGVRDADAFEFSLGARENYDIQWMEPKDYLLIGTLAGPFKLGPDDPSQATTPLNVIAKKRTSIKCAKKPPISVDDVTLIIQKFGKKLHEFTYQWERDGYAAPDLTQLSEHLVQDGISGMVFQQEPIPVVWMWTETGDLLSLTYSRENGIVALNPHPMDNGTIESLAVIPGDDRDEVWAIINRTINGSTARYVELMAAPFNDSAATFTSNKGLNAIFSDSCVSYSSPGSATLTGLDHLEGETVVVFADGGVQASKTVSSGQITIAAAPTVAHVGLGYDMTIQPLRFDAALQDGTSSSKTRRVVDVILRVLNSSSFKCGRDENNLDEVYDRQRTFVFGQAYPLFTGDVLGWYEGEFDRLSQPLIVQDKPIPLTVLALILELDYS